MPIAPIDNFTVTDVTFQVVEGQNVVDTQSTALIVFTPDQGYSITASDFVLNTPIPSEINGATSVFSQSGLNVILTAVFMDPTTMPSSDLEIPLCIRGFSRVVTIKLTGDITIDSSNSNINSSIALYDISGDYGTTSQVLNTSLVADAGHYFKVEPTLFISKGIFSDYSITTNSTSDANGYLVSKNFVVDYTFPKSEVIGDSIDINANAVSLPSVAGELVRSYTISGSNILQGGENRILSLTGGPNADWTVTAKGTGLDFLETGKLSSTGTSNVSIPFPSGESESYIITLSGDLLSPFPLLNPFVLSQVANTTISFTPTTIEPFTITPSVISRQAEAGNIPLSGSQSNVFLLNYVITAASSIWIANTISGGDWVFPVFKDGSVVSITDSEIFYTTTGVDTSVTLRANATISVYGNSNMAVAIDMDTLISIPV